MIYELRIYRCVPGSSEIAGQIFRSLDRQEEWP